VDQLLSAKRQRIVVFGALLLGLAGCDKLRAKKQPSAKACEDYAARICKEAGDSSPLCASVKSTTELLTPDTCELALTHVSESVKVIAGQRKKCDELVTKLCAEVGPSTPTCEMVKTQTKTFPTERCGQMLEHFPEVLASLRQEEAKSKPLPPEKMQKLVAAPGPAFGPADAKVVIVEFSDFQCPFCSRAATTVHALKEKYGDKVHFVFRQFPLSFHQNAHLSAEAALAANAQGKFWEFHDKLFANQANLDRASLEGYAKDVGLNVVSFKKALDDKAFAATVDAESKLGEEVAVDGTPTMFLNGKRVENPTDLGELSKQIDAALQG
jgi:protein-disulfide isomerase